MINFIKKHLMREQTTVSPKPGEMLTAPVTDKAVADSVIETIDYYPSQLQIGTGQSVGRQRDRNEDALFVFDSIVSDGHGQSLFSLLIVADGMGGHQYGEVASGTATRAIVDYLARKLFPRVMGADNDSQGDTVQEMMERAVLEAHQEVQKKAPGGGTTLTAALIMGQQVTLAHVGDSRAYFIFDDHRIQVMTQDHTLVRRLVELGQLTEEQARVYPQKNVVYRAMGQLEPFKPDIHTHMFPNPGYIMVCSDGLWGCVPDEEMAKIIRQFPEPSLACHKLVEAANQAGGPDNISVIIARFL